MNEHKPEIQYFEDGKRVEGSIDMVFMGDKATLKLMSGKTIPKGTIFDTKEGQAYVVVNDHEDYQARVREIRQDLISRGISAEAADRYTQNLIAFIPGKGKIMPGALEAKITDQSGAEPTARIQNGNFVMEEY